MAVKQVRLKPTRAFTSLCLGVRSDIESFECFVALCRCGAVFLSMSEQSWLASVRSKVPENIRYVNSEVLIGRPMQKQRRFLRPIDSIKSQSGCPDKGSTKN